MNLTPLAYRFLSSHSIPTPNALFSPVQRRSAPHPPDPHHQTRPPPPVLHLPRLPSAFPRSATSLHRSPPTESSTSAPNPHHSSTRLGDHRACCLRGTSPAPVFCCGCARPPGWSAAAAPGRLPASLPMGHCAAWLQLSQDGQDLIQPGRIKVFPGGFLGHRGKHTRRPDVGMFVLVVDSAGGVDVH
jgi:hypothetical protein